MAKVALAGPAEEFRTVWSSAMKLRALTICCNFRLATLSKLVTYIFQGDAQTGLERKEFIFVWNGGGKHIYFLVNSVWNLNPKRELRNRAGLYDG